MEFMEKQISYKVTNTYTTLNVFSEKTQNVWIVLHGLGYLSRFFLRYFDELPPDENYIIAPQAPSKYYLDKKYKYVGASWLTKENTALETDNVLAYLDGVYKAENIPPRCRLLIFGFSQGVSIVARWVAKRQLKCDHLVFYAGEVPREIAANDFKFLNQNQTKITVIVGNKDEYLTEQRLTDISKRIQVVFEGRAEQLVFEGGHEVRKQIINGLI
ncbi:serine hydrolase family protein [Flavobacteriaceae bacterium F89]|uniref:Serine hydrolase family protein n=2 Tax=Cerina litoralis TaxID=2874477 RepID=A0AAE3JPZ0_9FLAO|nr:serine hydrolase family protein [Cerina litoralis]